MLSSLYVLSLVRVMMLCLHKPLCVCVRACVCVCMCVQYVCTPVRMLASLYETLQLRSTAIAESVVSLPHNPTMTSQRSILMIHYIIITILLYTRGDY